MRKFISLFVLILFATLAFAQHVPDRIRFEHLTVADGLPENSVTCMIQDHLGFIWLGTLNGLARYDGAKMTSFQINPDNPYSFKGRLITSLLEDKNGDIWIGSENLFRFERATQRFIEYPNKNLSQKYSSFIEFIHEDKEGYLWTGIYINQQPILNKFDPKTSSWTSFSNDPGKTNYIAGNTTHDIGFAEDKYGNIWVDMMGENENILQWFDRKKDKFIPFNLQSGLETMKDFEKIGGISFNNQGLLYLSSRGKGWFILNIENGQIRQFRHDAADSNSLLCDTTLTAYQDKKGFVWITTSRGLDRYDPATNIFYHYISKPGDLTTPSAGLVFDPHETPEGDIWFKGKSAINFYNHNSNRFTRYESDVKQGDALWGDGYLRSIFIDRTGMVWLGTSNLGLNKESRSSQFPLIKSIPGNTNSLQDGDIVEVYEAPSEPGIVWFGTNMGLDRYDKRTGSCTHYRHDEHKRNSIGEGTVNSITEDTKKRLWVGSHGCLNLMDRRKGQFIHFKNDTTNANSLINNDIHMLKSGTDGTLWIGTNAGLDHFDFENNEFKHYTVADTTYTPDLFNLISQYPASEQRVAAIMHPADNVNMTVPFNLSQPTDLLVTGMGEIRSSIRSDWGWIENGEGKIIWDMNFANTLNDGNGRVRSEVIRLTTGNYRLRYKSDDSYSYGHWRRPAPLHAILWGIQLRKIDKSEIPIFNKELAKRYFNGLKGSRIFCITEDSKKNIWIGTDGGGISKLNTVTGKFITYFDDFNGPSSITDILEDKKTGNFWVGDYFFGMLLINSNGDILKRYNTSNGLPSNSVFAILQDAKGILWLSTDNGLCRFDPVNGQFQWYNKKNGLQGLRFNGSNFKTLDGEIYFGGTNGVNGFYPDQINLDTMAPPVIFTDLDIAGKPATLGKGGQMPEHISVAKDIRLHYNQNDLTFHFTSMLFNRGDESRFAYKLSPNDKDWVQSGAIRQARYINLNPGTYTFSVKAANADGVWNEKGTSTTIIILPPWWKTWWAYTLYVIILFSSIFWFLAYRSAALKRENIILEEKVELRTAQLHTSMENLKATQSQLIQSEKMASLGELTAGIAHEIQNPLNFVNNFSEINKELLVEMKEEMENGHIDEAKRMAGDILVNEDKINHHGKRADGIIKGMLQHSRASTGQKEPTDINALVDEYLRLSYHGLRAKDKFFNANIETDFDAAIGRINIIPQDIGRVLLNLFNNAFYAVSEKAKKQIRGYEPKVSVATKKAGDKIQIRIKDNGNGIPQKVIDKIFQPFFTTKPTGQGTGLGLSLSYDIIKAHGGELKVESQEGEGAEFVVHIPVV